MLRLLRRLCVGRLRSVRAMNAIGFGQTLHHRHSVHACEQIGDLGAEGLLHRCIGIAICWQHRELSGDHAIVVEAKFLHQFSRGGTACSSRLPDPRRDPGPRISGPRHRCIYAFRDDLSWHGGIIAENGEMAWRDHVALSS